MELVSNKAVAEHQLVPGTTQHRLNQLGFSPVKTARTVERRFRRLGENQWVGAQSEFKREEL
ncbi:MAG: hypothetical protein FJ194_02320 [Gammaproteobacteria bacterium]|nr:hypothetical protein [Gammaproteobacteria bacterium]